MWHTDIETNKRTVLFANILQQDIKPASELKIPCGFLLKLLRTIYGNATFSKYRGFTEDKIRT